MQKTVLAVDDDISVLIFVEQILKAEGYRVQMAPGARDALVMMAEAVPDLAILDVDMPEMNGLALLAAMRDDARFCKVPVMFLTVKDAAADEMRGLKAGVVDYLSKSLLTPERVDALRYRVRNFFMVQENERLRGVLATIVSANHEINNPMTVVSGGIDLMRLKGWVIDRPEARETLDRIIAAERRIRSVMVRIATLTHFEVKPYLDGVEMLDLGLEENPSR